MRRRTSGFTLVELLLAVAIIGILAAIAVPNLANAVQRARQRRTMTDMRAVANAVSSYGVDWVAVPHVVDGTVNDILPYITPTYLRRKPVEDGWNNPMHYYGNGLDYTIWSFARDNTQQSPLTSGSTTTFDADIVLVNGVFVQWPEGMQVR